MNNEDLQEFRAQGSPQPPEYAPRGTSPEGDAPRMDQRTEQRFEHTFETGSRETKPAAHSADADSAADRIRENSYNIAAEGSGKTAKKRSEKFLAVALVSGVAIAAILVGAGMAFFYPKPQPAQPAALTPAPAANSGTTNAAANPDGDVIIVYGGNEVDTAQSSVLPAAPQQASQQNLKQAPTQVETPAPALAKTEAAPVATTKTELVAAAPKPAPAPVAAKAPAKPKVAAAPKAEARPEMSPVTKQPLASTRQETYWVQVFSTIDRTRALSIKDELAQRGITSTIVAKNINDELYYRLRIGPYYNKAESDKFLSWVKQIRQYKDAYISVSYS